jgi:hypothetical protein
MSPKENSLKTIEYKGYHCTIGFNDDDKVFEGCFFTPHPITIESKTLEKATEMFFQAVDMAITIRNLAYRRHQKKANLVLVWSR